MGCRPLSASLVHGVMQACGFYRCAFRRWRLCSAHGLLQLSVKLSWEGPGSTFLTNLCCFVSVAPDGPYWQLLQLQDSAAGSCPQVPHCTQQQGEGGCHHIPSSPHGWGALLLGLTGSLALIKCKHLMQMLYSLPRVTCARLACFKT